jgi:hypothetical protein
MDFVLAQPGSVISMGLLTSQSMVALYEPNAREELSLRLVQAFAFSQVVPQRRPTDQLHICFTCLSTGEVALHEPVVREDLSLRLIQAFAFSQVVPQRRPTDQLHNCYTCLSYREVALHETIVREKLSLRLIQAFAFSQVVPQRRPTDQPHNQYRLHSESSHIFKTISFSHLIGDLLSVVLFSLQGS